MLSKILGFALLMLCALASCGVSPEWDNHGYGWEHDAVSSNGIKVSWSRAAQSGNWADELLMHPEFYERTWQRMKDCTGMDGPTDGMYIVLMPADYIKRRYGPNIGGKYYSDPPLIVAGETAFLVRHEIGHHFLLHTTGDSDHNHVTAMFQTPNGCTFTVPWN